MISVLTVKAKDVESQSALPDMSTTVQIADSLKLDGAHPHDWLGSSYTFIRHTHLTDSA